MARQTRFDLGPIPENWDDQVNVLEYDKDKVEFSARFFYDQQLEWHVGKIAHACVQMFGFRWNPIRPSVVRKPATGADGLVSTSADAFTFWVAEEFSLNTQKSISIVYADGRIRTEVECYDFYFSGMEYQDFLLTSQPRA
ncbi:hypothetical protein [Tateyamaria sp. SN6-1]|uniref:hypothetical protein n=1 Tax=Tateyamaria sp. SN6-1 TaxID=3092148 RepID=UPI0039F49D90